MSTEGRWPSGVAYAALAVRVEAVARHMADALGLAYDGCLELVCRAVAVTPQESAALRRALAKRRAEFATEQDNPMDWPMP